MFKFAFEQLHQQRNPVTVRIPIEMFLNIDHRFVQMCEPLQIGDGPFIQIRIPAKQIANQLFFWNEV